MEKRLNKLFDYQRFENNAALQSVIDSVHSRYAMRELDLDELSSISAAGVPDKKNKKDDQK